MNILDLREQLAAKLGITHTEAERFVNTLIQMIYEKLREGDKVNISGFGAFIVVARSARMGVNPQNPQQKIQIAATKVPKFRAGKNLKEAVRMGN